MEGKHSVGIILLLLKEAQGRKGNTTKRLGTYKILKTNIYQDHNRQNAQKA